MIQNTQYGMIVRQFCNLTGGADSLPQKKLVLYNIISRIHVFGLF